MGIYPVPDQCSVTTAIISQASLVAQTVKNLPVMQETQVQSLDQEVPLEKGMEPTPVLFHGELHGQRSLVGYSA